MINAARHSIDVTMYEFSDTTAEHDLAAAAERGVRVRVILDRRARSVNSDAYSYLGSHRVAVTWSSPDYHYTHQKTVITDGMKAVVMTANLTSRYYATSRDFLVVDTERADVSAITAVFNADFKKKAVRSGDGSDLVWSPTDSQDHLIGLINGATSSLRIYSEEMGDRTIENALIRAAERGVDVQICGENESGEYDSAFTKLARAGIRISYYSPSPPGVGRVRVKSSARAGGCWLGLPHGPVSGVPRLVRAGLRAGLDGGGLSVTPERLWDPSPYYSLAAGT